MDGKFQIVPNMSAKEAESLTEEAQKHIYTELANKIKEEFDYHIALAAKRGCGSTEVSIRNPYPDISEKLSVQVFNFVKDFYIAAGYKFDEENIASQNHTEGTITYIHVGISW